jgi:N6-adenosine-specific RNA methylase IME4
VKYGAILIDPPVPFAGWIPSVNNRTAASKYDLMTWDVLKAIRSGIDRVAADDCCMFLWVCSPLLVETMDLVRAWGWTYKTTAFTWVKTNKDRVGMALKMGYWTRANAEFVWLLSRGSPKRRAMDVLQAIHSETDYVAESPAICTYPGKHSTKPEEVATRIERLVDGPYLEMFARRRREGWTTIGNELDGLDIRESLARVAADEPLPALGLSLLDMEAV